MKTDTDITKEIDEKYEEAVSIVRLGNRASIVFLQCNMQIGYNRAARLIEAMESDGIITAMNSHGKRKVLAAI